jgi:pimeloyl-ACP methyl ester carboxylesterase
VAWSWSDRAGFLDVGGRRLECASFGPPPDEAPTLVLLHEGLGCVELWRDFPSRLQAATGFGVFVYSRLGYGASDPRPLPRPLDYMTREAVDVLPRVLDAVGFQRGVLVGHSDGATIAAIHAGSVEDFRVRGLVLMAPHFFTEPGGLASIRAACAAYDQGDLKRKLARYHSNVEAAFRGWCDAWLDPGFERWNVADVIDYWRIPALVIQGHDDEYGTLAQVSEIETRTYSPVDKLILDGVKHHPHLEAQEATLAEIADFCTRLERIERARPETAAELVRGDD